jgi:hypothetical protein
MSEGIESTSPLINFRILGNCLILRSGLITRKARELVTGILGSGDSSVIPASTTKKSR